MVLKVSDHNELEKLNELFSTESEEKLLNRYYIHWCKDNIIFDCHSW